VAVVAAAVAVLLAGLLRAARPAEATDYVPITGSGSTWASNAIRAWTADVAQYGVSVDYSPSGDTAGREDFAAGESDFGATEIPYGVQDGEVTDPPPSRGYAYMPDLPARPR